MPTEDRFKFRAWEKCEDAPGRMIPWKGMYGLEFDKDGNLSVHVAEGDQYYIFHDEMILMQSTDRRDNKRTEEYPKGQLAYDGDIIVNGYHILNEPYMIKWALAYCGPCWCACDNHGVPDSFYGGLPDEFRILGNIHENPELMEAPDGN